MIRNIRDYLERRRVRRTFEKVTDPKTVEAILRGDITPHPFREARIEFVLVFVRGDNPAQVSERMGEIIDVALKHGALIHNLVGAFVIVAFGTHPSSMALPVSRVRLVEALRCQMAADIKIVHGGAEGHYGSLGSKRFLSYTFLVPKFDAMLGALSRLEFGQVEEFRQ